MYNKLNLAVGKVASKSSIKPELKSIAFFGDRTVATDSFRLLEVSAPGAALDEPVMLDAKYLKGNLKVTPEQDLDVNEIMERSGAKPVVGNFPKYKEIIEPAMKREGDIKFSVNGKYMAEMLAIMATTNKFAQVEFSIPQGPGLPIIMVAKTAKTKDNPDQQVVRGLLMPMNR